MYGQCRVDLIKYYNNLSRKSSRPLCVSEFNKLLYIWGEMPSSLPNDRLEDTKVVFGSLIK